MERGRIENPLSALEGLNLGSPSSQSKAATFADVLDIIFRVKYISPLEVRALRLVCKATRIVVDSRAKYFRSSCRGDVQVHLSICDLAPWPWPNVSHIVMDTYFRREPEVLQRDAEYLATIPLFNLTYLAFFCMSVLPLVDCKFPRLTELHLTILHAGNEVNLPSYPRNLHFPRWPLKKLSIESEVEVEANPSVCTTDSISFLGPLLRSGVELTEFRLRQGAICTQVMADMIVSAPLPRLKNLVLESTRVSTEFYSTLFSRDWPALKNLNLIQPPNGILALISSSEWLKQLEDVTISFKYCIDATAEGLHSFLKGLENGVVEEVNFSYLPLKLLKSFRGISLETLKFFYLRDMVTFEAAEEGNLDVSAFINVLFEGYNSFPNLDQLSITIHLDCEDKELPKWVTPPRIIAKKSIASFPKLNDIGLEKLAFSRRVAEYLGNFRSLLYHYKCDFEPTEPYSEYQLILNKLGVDYDQWQEFCQICLDYEAFEEFVYWNAMSVGRFKRIAYGAVLLKSTDATKLAAFINLVEAEEDGTVMEKERLEELKSFLNRLQLDATRLRVWERFTWGDVKLFFNFE